MELKLDEKQKEIVMSPEKFIAVRAAFATGKTTVLTSRISWLLAQGVPPDQIVAITFTTYAAQEIKARLVDLPSGVFIGTIHSYANFLLGIKGIDTSHLIDQERFDEFFELIQENTDCIRPVEHLLVDEYQDVSEDQDMFFRLINPKGMFIIYDVLQNIYSFRGSSPEYALDWEDDPRFKVYTLEVNYRNKYNISDFAVSRTREDTSHVAKQFSKKGTGVIQRLYMENLEEIIHYISVLDDYGDWFILCRTNQQVSDILWKLRSEEIPCVTFKMADLKTEAGKSFLASNSVKVMTIHSSKGLQAKNVVVIGAQYYNDEEARLNYVAASRAEERLYWIDAAPKKKKQRGMKNWG